MRTVLCLCLLLAACSSETPTAQQECESQGGVFHEEREECFGVDESPKASAERSVDATPEATPRPTPRPTPQPTPTPLAQQDLVLVEQGFTQLSSGGDTEWAQVGIVFENPNTDTHVARFVNVQLTFFDANNALAGSSEEVIGPILPGQFGAIGTSVFDVSNATEMEVEFRVDWETIDFEAGSFSFDQVTTTAAEFGGYDTAGFVVSSFEQEQENVQVVAIYKDPEGNVLGGDFTFVDFVPAGGRSPFNIGTFSQFDVQVDATDMYAFTGF